MLLPVINSLVVQAEEDLRLLRFQWAVPSMQPIRPAFEWGRDLLVARQPTRTLVDFTGLPPIGLADELWLVSSWLPVIAAQSLEQAALVFPRRYQLHNQLALEPWIWVARRLISFPFQLFDEAPMALHWLTGSAETVQRLQTEWLAARPLARF